MRLDKVKSLLKEYHDILIAKQRASQLEAELKNEKRRRTLLSEKLELELEDIQQLEKQSIKSVFIRFLKNKQEQLEKQNQDYLLVALELNECSKLIELLEYELEILNSKDAESEYVLKDLERQLNAIPEELLLGESIYLEEFKSFSAEMRKLYFLQIEGQEALEVTQDLKNGFTVLVHCLEGANKYDSWGQYYAEKQEAKAKKKTYVDKAQQQVYTLKKLLLILNDELTDVEEFKQQFRLSEALIRGFNVKYYKHLITDWVENMSIVDTIVACHHAIGEIEKLEHSLQKLISEAIEESKILETKREFIISKYFE